MHKEFQRVQYIKVEKEDKFFSSIAKKYKGRYYKNLKQGAGWSFPFEYKEQIDQQRIEFMSKGTNVLTEEAVEKSVIAEILEIKAPVTVIETEQAPVTVIENKAPTAEIENKAPTAEIETEQAPTAEIENKAPTAEIENKAPVAEIENKAPTAEIENKAPVAETLQVKAPTDQAKISKKPIVKKTFENKQDIDTSIKPKAKAPILYSKISKPTQTDLENHKYKYDLPDSYKHHFVFYKNLIQRTN